MIWLDLARAPDKFYPECDLWEEALIPGEMCATALKVYGIYQG